MNGTENSNRTQGIVLINRKFTDFKHFLEIIFYFLFFVELLFHFICATLVLGNYLYVQYGAMAVVCDFHIALKKVYIRNFCYFCHQFCLFLLFIIAWLHFSLQLIYVEILDIISTWFCIKEWNFVNKHIFQLISFSLQYMH